MIINSSIDNENMNIPISIILPERKICDTIKIKNPTGTHPAISDVSVIIILFISSPYNLFHRILFP